jgi:drug/metabolite transporter (DMT)-like permease
MSVIAAASARGTSYAAGLAILLAAGLVLSSGGLILRQIEVATGWQIQSYRSIGMVTALLGVIAWQYRGRVGTPFRAMGWSGIGAALCLAIGMITYIFAILMTTVANAMFVISAGPFLSALLGWLLLGEVVRRLTWVAIAIAALGMAVMVADGLASGGLTGMALAAISIVAWAGMIVMLRRHRGLDMLPALVIGATVSGLVSLVIAGDLSAPAADIGFALLLGAAQTGTGTALIMLGARRVPAAQVALLLLTEVIVAPFWVWLFVGETPRPVALAGGLIVLGAVMAQAVAGVLWERRAIAA